MNYICATKLILPYDIKFATCFKCKDLVDFKSGENLVKCQHKKCQKLLCKNCFNEINTESKDKICEFCKKELKYEKFEIPKYLQDNIDQLLFYCPNLNNKNCVEKYTYNEMLLNHNHSNDVLKDICIICKKEIVITSSTKCSICFGKICLDVKSMCSKQCFYCQKYFCKNCFNDKNKYENYICQECKIKCAICKKNDAVTVNLVNLTNLCSKCFGKNKEKNEKLKILTNKEKMCEICKRYLHKITCYICKAKICINKCFVLCNLCNKNTCKNCALFCKICKNNICIKCGDQCSNCKEKSLEICKKCNTNCLIKCNIKSCNKILCISCAKFCNYCKECFCDNHSLSCKGCMETICQFHWHICPLCSKSKEDKLCLKNCVIKCSNCNSTELNILCEEKNHKDNFCKKYKCNHYICNLCLRICDNCKNPIKTCTECLVDYEFNYCKYCNRYLCYKCCKQCLKCGEFNCDQVHKCFICNKEIPVNTCLKCEYKERDRCCICSKYLNPCENCSSKFICSKECYRWYFSEITMSENEGKKLNDLKRVSTTNSNKSTKQTNSNSYSKYIFENKNNKSRNKKEHLCLLFWCEEHYGLDKTFTISTLNINSRDCNLSYSKPREVCESRDKKFFERKKNLGSQSDLNCSSLCSIF